MNNIRLTEKGVRDALNDIIINTPNRGMVIYAVGYIDENNNIKCGFLEEFDKAIKEEFNNQYEKRN